VSIAHSHELMADEPSGPVADAFADVEAGHISYLTRGGHPVAALVSVGELAELQAAHDAVEVAEVEAIRTRPGPQIPHDVIEAMIDADDATHDAMAAALDAHDGEDVSPAVVRVMWQAVQDQSHA
jgi:antitoxin (DNA-binding transcriptional repressor) of toxin-antitoxin stability system